MTSLPLMSIFYQIERAEREAQKLLEEHRHKIELQKVCADARSVGDEFDMITSFFVVLYAFLSNSSIVLLLIRHFIR